MPSPLKSPYIHGSFSGLKALLQRESAFFCAVVFGAALRTYQLPNQILFGDEWHAVHAAANAGYFKILSTFGGADHSIPITLYYKVLMDTMGLSEMGIRIPFLVGGILTVLIPPIMVRPMVGRTVSNIFAWLLALSPTLIFYSRFARPYALITFFSFLSCLFFFRWWKNNNKKDAILYAISTIATGYALLVALPFVLGPFLYFLVLSVAGKGRRKENDTPRLLALGMVTMVPLAILLAPPICGDFSAISAKAGQATFDIFELGTAFRMLTGMDERSIAILMAILVLIGCKRLFVQAPIFIAYLVSLSLLQVLAIFLIQPVGVDAPHILARYLLPALPCLLLPASMGIHGISSTVAMGSGKWTGIVVSMFFCALFFWGGPISAVSYRPNNGMSLTLLVHALAGSDYQSILKRIPDFYKRLGVLPRGSVTVVEAPFPWQASHLLLYQEVHHQTVIMGATGERLSSLGPDIRLKTLAPIKDPHALAAMGVDFLVLHKNLQGEVSLDLPADPSKHQNMKAFPKLFGRSIYEDRDLVVFAVSDWAKSFNRKDNGFHESR